jgi:hypothetical protein
MNNPIEYIKNVIKNPNISQILTKMVGNNNPMMNNLINMASKGDKQGVEAFARNLFKGQGRDFDKEFADFMGEFK